MSRAKKCLIIIAAACVFLGLVISFSALAKEHFNINVFTITGETVEPETNESGTVINEQGKTRYQTKTFDLDEEFDKIKVDTDVCDVKVEKSPDGKKRVIIFDETADGIETSVGIAENTLKVVRRDRRNFYSKIGVFQMSTITVQLAESSYDEIDIENMSGDTYLSEGLTFDEAEVSDLSGDIISYANAVQDFSAKTASGSLKLNNINASGEISAEAKSGDITLNNVVAGKITAQSASGDISMRNVVSKGEMMVQTASADITLDLCDAKSLNLKSASGDIEGSLLSDKMFVTHSASGDIRVPESKGEQICQISTASGDIDIIIR